MTYDTYLQAEYDADSPWLEFHGESLVHGDTTWEGETIVFSPSEFIFPLSRVLTFSTTESLHILSQADQILIDSTFRTTPALWKQVTIRMKMTTVLKLEW